MDRFDEELRARLTEAAREIRADAERESVVGVATQATGARRVSGRGQLLGVAAAITVLAIAAAQLLPAGDEQGSLLAPDTETTAEPPASPTPYGSPSPDETTPPWDPSISESPPPDPASPSPQPPPAQFKPRRGCSAPMERSATPLGVRVTLASDKEVVLDGEKITFTIRVRNEGLTPVTYNRGGQEYDFWVQGAGSSHLEWRWMAGRAATTPYIEETLAPGEERTAAVTWSGASCDEGTTTLRAGSYEVRGLWVSSSEGGAWWSDPVAFEIT